MPFGAIGLVDPHRARCPDAMGMEEYHDLEDRPLIGRAYDNPIGAFWTNAIDFLQPTRLRFDVVTWLPKARTSFRA
jgi:hypothetical protein